MEINTEVKATAIIYIIVCGIQYSAMAYFFDSLWMAMGAHAGWMQPRRPTTSSTVSVSELRHGARYHYGNPVDGSDRCDRTEYEERAHEYLGRCGVNR